MEEMYALELIQKGKRIDGRKFADFRPIEITKNAISTAEGSARVKIGETEVIAGVKIGVGTPFPDTPNKGILIVNTEFTPLASPEFESGPPSENAVELSRIVDRGIRESETVELEKLCLVEGEKVFSIFVDIHIINHDGNLQDAAALAAIAALRGARLPKLEDDNKIVRGEYGKPLPVAFTPINVTVAKVGENLILDPNYEEEKILDSKLSISVRDDDRICALQKQGRKEIKFDDIEKMLDMAMEKSRELRKLI